MHASFTSKRQWKCIVFRKKKVLMQIAFLSMRETVQITFLKTYVIVRIFDYAIVRKERDV